MQNLKVICWPQVVHDFIFCRIGLLWLCLKSEKVHLTLAGRCGGHTSRALCCKSSCTAALCCQKLFYSLSATCISQPSEFEFWKTDCCEKGIFVVQHTGKMGLDSLKNIIDMLMHTYAYIHNAGLLFIMSLNYLQIMPNVGSVLWI